MSTLIEQIQAAQRDAGERAVIEHLEAGGLTTKSPDELLSDAKRSAHAATNVAERAWHAYAAMCEPGPERIHAFNIFERVRTARLG